MTFKIDKDAGVAGVSTLEAVATDWHSSTVERRTLEVTVKRESFTVILPKMVALGDALRAFATANGGDTDTPLGAILKAAALVSETLKAVLPRDGSEKASQLNSLRLAHNDERYNEYLASCDAQSHKVNDEIREWSAIAPTVGGYCEWLNVKTDNERGGKTLHAETNRVVRPAKKEEEAPETPPRDTAVVLAELKEAVSKLPAEFVPADYTLDAFTAIAEFATLVVEARTLKVTRKKMAI